MPLSVSGLKVAGVMPGTIFKSKVSVWLGAPASRTKITFFAVFIVRDGSCADLGGPGVSLERTAPPTPAPRISKNRRRVQ